MSTLDDRGQGLFTSNPTQFEYPTEEVEGRRPRRPVPRRISTVAFPSLNKPRRGDGIRRIDTYFPGLWVKRRKEGGRQPDGGADSGDGVP